MAVEMVSNVADFDDEEVSLLDLSMQTAVSRNVQQARVEVWRDRFKLSEIAEYVIFKPGSFKVLVKLSDGRVVEKRSKIHVTYVGKTPPTQRSMYGESVTCSCHNGLTRDQCLLHQVWANDVARLRSMSAKEQSCYTPKPQYAVTIGRVSYFHETQRTYTRRDGTAGTAPELERCLEGDAVVDLANCDCPGCVQGQKRVLGQRKYLSMGDGYRSAFTDIEHQVGEVCATCGGEIRTVRFVCPKCAKEGRLQVLMDPMRVVGMTDEEKSTYWKTAVQCPSGCGYMGKPQEQIKCRNQCGTPKRRSIYDVAVPLRKQPSAGAKSNFSTMVLANGPILNIVDMHLPEEFLKSLVVYDFDRMFAMTVQEQADLLGVSPANMQSPRAQQPGIPVPVSDTDMADEEVPF